MATAKKKKNNSRSLDAIALLKQDHEKVLDLLGTLENATGARREKLLSQIDRELKVHTQIEEELFYPALRDLRSKEAKELALEAAEEHGLAKYMLRRIQEAGIEDETFKAKLTVLKEVLLQHIREEEREMFAALREGLSEEELEELGGQLMRRKERLLSGGLGDADVETAGEEDEDYERAVM